MNPWIIVAVLAAVVAVVMVCRVARPGTGRRREPLPGTERLETLETFEAVCDTEDRVTVHFRTRVYGLVYCMDCRNPSGRRT